MGGLNPPLGTLVALVNHTQLSVCFLCCLRVVGVDFRSIRGSEPSHFSLGPPYLSTKLPNFVIVKSC